MKQQTQRIPQSVPESWQAFVQPMGKPKIHLGIFANHADALLEAKRSAERLASRFGEDELDHYGARRIAPDETATGQSNQEPRI